MESEGHLLIILHEPPTSEDDIRTGRIYWRNAEGQWMPKGIRHSEPALGELIAEYEKTIDQVDEREQIADSPEEYFEILKDLSPLVRSANNLHNTLQKAREAVPEDRGLIMLRDASYAMARRVELLASDTRHALDYRIAMRAEEQAANSEKMAASAHRLNLLVAFFFPLATIAGVFGMNLYNPLEDLSKQAGAEVLIGTLVVGLVLGLVLTTFVTQPTPKQQRRRRMSQDD